MISVVFTVLTITQQNVKRKTQLLPVTVRSIAQSPTTEEKDQNIRNIQLNVSSKQKGSSLKVSHPVFA